jgi:alcohol dehydrogenase (cytochrome c)
MFKTLKWTHGAAVVAFLAGLSAASAQQTIAPASTTPTAGPLPDILFNYASVTSERLKKPEDGNWLLFRRTYDGWGYSPLSQITPANVGRLQLVWSFATGQVEGHQAPPIVNNGVMFVATPGNQVLAIEAKTGTVLWRYKRPLPEDLTNLHPTSRGVGLYGDLLFFASADANLVAIGAAGGYRGSCIGHRAIPYNTLKLLSIISAWDSGRRPRRRFGASGNMRRSDPSRTTG